MKVLSKHESILSHFDAELARCRAALDECRPYADDPDVADLIRRIEQRVTTRCGKNAYIAQTCRLVNEYKAALKTPIAFRGAKPCKTMEIKTKLERNYDQIASRFVRGVVSDDPPQPPLSTIVCPYCNNSDSSLFETDDVGRRTCTTCASELQTLATGNTSLDYNRATMTGKFIYNRVLHFQDCIKQYQGKQNCKIPESVYSDLVRKFSDYRLLIESTNPLVRFSKITRQHVLMFLKELKHVKHFENVVFIYRTLTGKPVDDISHLERQLIDDFKELVNLYDSLHSKDKPEQLERKNFLNVQYLLFQLLRRHGYDCKIEDFAILKTTDRKQFHDKICCNLFQTLGWNFTPVF